MTSTNATAGTVKRGWLARTASLGLFLGMALTAGVAMAQTDETPKAEEPAAGEAKKKENVSSWVKLCEEVPISKDVKKNVCITHHERLDPASGMPIVSAAIRVIEGQEKQRFMVTVPLGMALPAGMLAKFDQKEEAVPLKYSFCLPNGCTAETEATEEMLNNMFAGKMLIVAAINALGEQINFQVPLNGFKSTYEGKPVDTAKFANARKALLMSIREKAIERMKAEEAKKGGKDDKTKKDAAGGEAAAGEAATTP